MADVIVVAGTADARQIIEQLVKLDIQVVATVTTKYGNELLSTCEGVVVYEGKLDSEAMAGLIKRTGARCLVDASHPFAKEASKNAIEACKQSGISYLRFERERTDSDITGVIRVKDFEEAACKADGFDGNILLTTGSNTVGIFAERIRDSRERLYVRVLPDSKVLAKCEQAGLSAGNIIAMKGPFSEGMNIEMLKHCSAKVLVTKDSGEMGGTDEKLEAARKLGLPVIMVERPAVEYTRKVDCIEDVIAFVRNTIGC